ncbi:MAG: HDIG domain-containing protein [Armatimonadetes bacterium]|nr:HDIG domain-containing protein [Armatimonadota bacterium]
MRPGKNNGKNGAPRRAGTWYSFALPSNLALRRATIAAVTVAALFVALWVRILPEQVRLEVGKPAPTTVIAPRSAFYVDTEKTEQARQAAEAQVPDQYFVKPNARELAVRMVRDIFDAVRRARSMQDIKTAQARVDWIKRELDVRVSDETLLLAVEASDGALARMEDASVSIVGRVMEAQIRDNTDDLSRAQEQARQAAAGLPMSKPYQQAVAEIAALAVQPNLIYDPAATEKLRKAAADQVQPVRGFIRVGDVVVYAGEQVRQRHIDICEALGLINPRIDYERAAALVILLSLLVVGYGQFVARYAPGYGDDKYLKLAAGLAIAASVVFRLAQSQAWFEPAAIGATICSVVAMALLANARVALGLGAGLSLLVGLMASGSDARLVLVTMMAMGAAAHPLARQSRSTSVIARVSVIAGISAAALLLLGNEVYGMITNWRLLGQTAVAGFSGALLGFGLVLVLQRPLRITTDLRLLELGSPNEPILRRILMEAPGTYQSSLMVSALAEAAAEAIGENALLARLAGLYHDIGKLKRPGFFVENQFSGENPHDRLSPHLSAMILVSHVTDGVEMARRLRLPPEIVSAIQEHHGTSLMLYFYERAKQQARPGEEVPESLFRYPGPKPRTKINAILMLADCVEAAARTLDSYDPETIRQMVDRVVQSKLEDGQLDEAPITLAEVTKVKEQLAHTLVSMFHHRIPYPEQVEKAMKALQREPHDPLEHREPAKAGARNNARGSH